MNDIDKLLTQINKPAYHKVMAEQTLNRFVLLNSWPTLQNSLDQNMLLFLYRHPLLTEDLSLKQHAGDMPYMQLFYCYSGDLLIGYLIQLPKQLEIENHRTFAVARRGPATLANSLDNIPKTETIFVDNRLNIYLQNNMLIIGSLQPEMVTFY